MTDVVIASAGPGPPSARSDAVSVRLAPTELGATVTRAAVERAGMEPDQVEQVVFGNVIHTAPEDMYMARVVGIRAVIPKGAPAFTVNRLCGSGVQAIVSAAQAIQTGNAQIVLAGGADSMSRGAYWLHNARWGARMDYPASACESDQPVAIPETPGPPHVPRPPLAKRNQPIRLDNSPTR